MAALPTALIPAGIFKLDFDNFPAVVAILPTTLGELAAPAARKAGNATGLLIAAAPAPPVNNPEKYLPIPLGVY